jgi:MYXO-CTERM domain-containing protein
MAACVFLLIALAALSLICALIVHHWCIEPPPPVSVPDPGTPLADYCSAADTAHPWPLALLAPVLAAFGIMLVRRRTRWTAWICLAIATAAVTNAIVASQLTSAHTI